MSLRVLWVTLSFPVNPDDKRSLYIWHSLEALQSEGVSANVLVTKPWQPKFAGKIHTDFLFEEIEYSAFSTAINLCRYISIPRHYFRALSNFCYLIRVAHMIRRLAKKYQADIIHAHGEIAGLAALSASKKLKIPAVVTIHGIDTCPRVRQGIAGKMFRTMLNKIDRLIFVGDTLQKYFYPMLNHHEHCRILYNGFKFPKTQKMRLKDLKMIGLISVSNLHEGKGVDLTLHALGVLKKQGIENWRYVIIGSGYQKKYLQKIILECGLAHHVEFKNDCPHDVVYGYLENATIFCLPSYREAFGIAYLEAMAHGLLTIAVRGQGPQAFIEHNKTGLLVEPQDIDSLTETLHLALTRYQEMQKIAHAGKQYALSNFGWKSHAQKLNSIYQEVLAERVSN